jgi:carboxymethylenebutenolidase
MKKLFFVISLLLFSGGVYAQESCCTPEGNSDKTSTSTTTNDPIAKFASNVDSPGFADKHPSPAPFKLTNGRGEMIKITLSDRSTANAYQIKAAHKSNKWLILFHEWWGLNDYIKNEAEKYANAFSSLNVIALDFYDGQSTANPDTAGMLLKGVKTERSMKIIEGTKKYLGANAQVGTLGWCFGGGLSMQAAIIFGKQAKACVLYYGMPETDAKKLKNLHAPVLGIFAEKDAWITRDVVSGFDKSFRPLKRKYELKWFDADHAFANPSSPNHNNAAALEAEDMTKKFIQTRLMGIK